MLSGSVFAWIYGLGAAVNPDIFTPPIDTARGAQRIGYFSFITLTTVGYGDIAPADDWVTGRHCYWVRRLEARVEFLEGIQALDPPEELADVHELALDLFSRLVAAEEALAARAATFETVTGHGGWWDTPEGRIARAVDEEALAFCQAAQSQLDATQEREALADLAWLPVELKQVVRIAFGCPSRSVRTAVRVARMPTRRRRGLLLVARVVERHPVSPGWWPGALSGRASVARGAPD